MNRTLSVTLPSGSLYVSGTVNDVVVTWTNTEGDVWEAVAERSVDDKYRVALTIINALGTSTEQSFTLYYGLHLITDRTAEDVRYASALNRKGYDAMTDEERTAFADGLKGSYNASDLNRVGAAMLYVADRFEECGYSATVSPKTDWKVADIPTEEQMAHYLADLATLRNALAVYRTTPDVPESMAKLRYTQANDIEKILEDVDELLTKISLTWVYSGEVCAGDV